MAAPIPITFRVNPKNPPQEGIGENVQELLNEIADSLSTSFNSAGFIIGQLNGTLPSSNVGPWANNGEWWTWNPSLGAYQRASDSIPVGTMIIWGGQGAPNNFLLCDGSEVLRSQYPDLFQAIGATWGGGDGVTTFNLPPGAKMYLSSPGFVPGPNVTADAGYAPNGVGGRGGNQLAPLLTTAQMPPMQIKIRYLMVTKKAPKPPDYGYALPLATHGNEYWIYQVQNTNGANLGSFGQVQMGFMPPFAAANFIIKAQ